MLVSMTLHAFIVMYWSTNYLHLTIRIYYGNDSCPWVSNTHPSGYIGYLYHEILCPLVHLVIQDWNIKTSLLLFRIEYQCGLYCCIVTAS